MAADSLFNLLNDILEVALECIDLNMIQIDRLKYNEIKWIMESPQDVKYLLLVNVIALNDFIVSDAKAAVSEFRKENWYLAGLHLGYLADEFIFGFPPGMGLDVWSTEQIVS